MVSKYREAWHIMEINVYDLLLEDERITVNEIVLEAIARNFDIDLNDFDYDIQGTILQQC